MYIYEKHKKWQMDNIVDPILSTGTKTQLQPQSVQILIKYKIEYERPNINIHLEATQQIPWASGKKKIHLKPYL